MFLFIANAFAQDAAKAAAPNMWASLLPFALIFVIFYFFLIRPQRKRMKEEDALLSRRPLSGFPSSSPENSGPRRLKLSLQWETMPMAEEAERKSSRSSF